MGFNWLLNLLINSVEYYVEIYLFMALISNILLFEQKKKQLSPPMATFPIIPICFPYVFPTLKVVSLFIMQ